MPVGVTRPAQPLPEEGGRKLLCGLFKDGYVPLVDSVIPGFLPWDTVPPPHFQISGSVRGGHVCGKSIKGSPNPCITGPD